MSRGPSWSSKESKGLVKLRNENKLVPEIAEELNETFWKGKQVRTHSAIECKLLKLRRRGDVRITKVIHPYFWPEEEVQKLIIWFNEGLPVSDIVTRLNLEFHNGLGFRNLKSIESKISKLKDKGFLSNKTAPKSNYSEGVLSEKSKKILLLRQKGLSLSEIATQLKFPAATVKSSLQYMKGQKVTPENPLAPISEEDLSNKILKRLQIGSTTLGDLSREFDRSKETIVRLIEDLKARHFQVSIPEGDNRVVLDKTPSIKFSPYIIKHLYSHTMKIGVVSDTHIGSKQMQLSLLHQAYREFEREGVDLILNAGDIFAGLSVFRGQASEIFLHDAQSALNYAVENYPIAKGITTYAISGNHDQNFQKTNGYSIVRHLCEKRSDICFRGDLEARFKIKTVGLYMLHPSGGSSYARSYRPQKIADAVISSAVGAMQATNDIQRIPQIMVVGHYHSFVHLLYGGSAVFSAPCLEGPTEYLIAKALAPDVGYMTIHCTFDDQWRLTKILPDVRILNHYVKEKDY